MQFTMMCPRRLLAALLTATLPPALTPASAQEKKIYPEAAAEMVPNDLFVVPEGLEVTLWASSPQLFNPTNIDIDLKGRIWVAEGVRYRKNFDRQPEGDRLGQALNQAGPPWCGPEADHTRNPAILMRARLE